MLKSEAHYQSTLAIIEKLESHLATEKARLSQQDLTPQEIQRILAPVESFLCGLKEDVNKFEQSKQAIFENLINFKGLGCLLAGIRIHRDLTTEDLAKELNMSEDRIRMLEEENEVQSLTMNEAQQILDALDATLVTTVRPMDKKQN